MNSPSLKSSYFEPSNETESFQFAPTNRRMPKSNLHGNSNSVLECGSVGTSDASAEGKVDLRCDLLHHASAGDTVATDLRLEDTHAPKSAVRSADGRDVERLGARVRGRRGERKVAVDLVKQADVRGRKLGRRHGREKGSRRVRRAEVVPGDSRLVAREVLPEAAADVDPRGDADACAGREFAHVQNVEGSRGGNLPGSVFNSKVGTLVRLKGYLAARAGRDRRLEDVGSIRLRLELVKV